MRSEIHFLSLSFIDHFQVVIILSPSSQKYVLGQSIKLNFWMA